jgi:hypothetical protein
MFAEGKLMAYYEILSMIINQAKTFGIDLKNIKLDDIDSDKDLI